jgi:hypothetical protein
MTRKRKKMTPEERAERDARSEKVTRMLEERIAYHESKLGKERGSGAGAERKTLTPKERADWEARSEERERKLLERIAYHEEKLEEERRAAASES